MAGPSLLPLPPGEGRGEGLLYAKTALVTGAASGIGRARTRAMLEAGATVVAADRDQPALDRLRDECGPTLRKHLHPLPIDLLDPADCATLIPRALEATGQLDILHANAGLYLGGDLVDADPAAIDRTVSLNVAVVMKNVRDVLPHMIARRTGDVVVTSSLAAHFPTPWEPVYAASKWAIDCFVQTTRRQVFRHGIRMGAISPGPVVTALIADWPPEKLEQARRDATLLDPAEIAEALLFALSRPRTTTIRDIVLLPTNFDL